MNVYPLVVHLPFCLGIPGKFCIEELTGYGLMMMVAFLMAGWVIQVDLRRRHMNEDYAADIVFGAVVGGIVGAKIWYVLLTGAWDALFGRGGVVWYGGGSGRAAMRRLHGRRAHATRVPKHSVSHQPLASPAHTLGRSMSFST